MAEEAPKSRPSRDIKWDTGAWRPIDAPCATCHEKSSEKAAVVSNASPRPGRQVSPSAAPPAPASIQVQVTPSSVPKPSRPQQPQQQSNNVRIPLKPTTLLFQVGPQIVQPVEIAPAVVPGFLFPAGEPRRKPSDHMHPPPHRVPVGSPISQSFFPSSGRNPNNNNNNRPPPPSPQTKPGTTVLLLPTHRNPSQPAAPAPAADKVIIEVNKSPEKPESEITVGKSVSGSGKPRVQLIYIPAATLRGRKDPLENIKGPVTDKLLAELNLPGAKIVSVVKTDPAETQQHNRQAPGLKQLSPFSVNGKLNLDFVRSFLPSGAELVSIRGLNGQLDVDGSFEKKTPSQSPSQSFSNSANSIETGFNSPFFTNSPFQNFSPKFRQPSSSSSSKSSLPSKQQVFSSQNDNNKAASFEHNVDLPEQHGPLSLVLNSKAFKVEQDLSLMIHNLDKKNKIDIDEVIRSLRNINSGSLANFHSDFGKDVDYPKVFIAPATLSPPAGYAKIDLKIPKVQVTSGPKAPNSNLPNAYIASREHLPPDGYVKIDLPEEVNANTIPETKQFVGFKDSHEKTLESGSHFLPRPFVRPSVADSIASLNQFWIQPAKSNSHENDRFASSGTTTTASPLPSQTTTASHSGFRFWPTTNQSPFPFQSLFPSSLQTSGGFVATTTPTPTTTTVYHLPSTTARPFVFPTTYKSTFPKAFFPPPQQQLDVTKQPNNNGGVGHLPEAFIGPSDIETPDGYVKIQLPVPGIENPRGGNGDGFRNLDEDEENTGALPEFFIAPADQEPPEGYVRIALPVAATKNNQIDGDNNEDDRYEPTLPPTTIESTTTTTTLSTSSTPVFGRQIPGRLFGNQLGLSGDDNNADLQSVNRQRVPVRPRPAYLRPRGRPTQEPAAVQGTTAAPRAEDSQVIKSREATLFPPYQEAVKRFRGRYHNDIKESETPAAAAATPDAPAPVETTTSSTTTVSTVRPGFGTRTIRRPINGVRRKVLLNRRPIARTQEPQDETPKPQETESVPPATTTEGSTEHDSSRDLEISGSRFVYHHQPSEVDQVLQSDPWWVHINSKPSGELKDNENNDDYTQENEENETLDPASREDSSKNDDKTGAYSSFVSMPADNEAISPVAEPEPAAANVNSADSKDSSSSLEQGQLEDNEGEEEDPQRSVESAEESKSSSSEQQSPVTATPEPFTATIPALKHLLEQQGINSDYVEDIARELLDAEQQQQQQQQATRLESPDASDKYLWKYTAINRPTNREDMGAEEEKSDSKEPEDLVEEPELPEDELILEPEQRPAKPVNQSPPEMSTVAPVAEVEENSQVEEGDGESVPNPNDIKILGVSTATERSQVSVICFKNKCVKQEEEEY
ncbi:unnamed protein product [Notodromas monacha]|uniref:Uncharacterized protein n=1 Tax=Notodromas monacha TaxID=399045 RepID=A0A7R9GG65_9CRUS|nr:unnamed protein product [Notodromas monacha]CAG0921512.1 unnamed protein product [Notodromas monacha]